MKPRHEQRLDVTELYLELFVPAFALGCVIKSDHLHGSAYFHGRGAHRRLLVSLELFQQNNVLAFTTISGKHDDRFSLALSSDLNGDLHALRDSFTEMQTAAGTWINRYDLKPADQFCSRMARPKSGGENVVLYHAEYHRVLTSAQYLGALHKALALMRPLY